MILSRSPVRISLLGGGTDYPQWSTKHGGIVVGGSINKYSYLSTRYLPPFHEFKSRIVYSSIEHVNENDQIEHRAIRAVLKFLELDKKDSPGLEVAHQSDLPSRSGTGSSSTFIVGLLNALGALQGRLMLPHFLAESAIHVEQAMMGETVGCQDQIFAAYGGLNSIRFKTDGEYSILPLTFSAQHIEELESHLMLFFTKIARTSSNIAQTYVPTIEQKEREQFAMMALVERGIEALYQRDWELLGKLIDQSWRIKSSMSAAVTNDAINNLYLTARVAGAFGGKITGAGGGGMLLLVVPPEKHQAVKELLKDLIYVPFKFSFDGSQIVFCDKDNISEYRPSR